MEFMNVKWLNDFQILAKAVLLPNQIDGLLSTANIATISLCRSSMKINTFILIIDIHKM